MAACSRWPGTKLFNSLLGFAAWFQGVQPGSTKVYTKVAPPRGPPLDAGDHGGGGLEELSMENCSVTDPGVRSSEKEKIFFNGRKVY